LVTVLGRSVGLALDAVLARALADETVDRILARVEATGVAQRVAERVLADGIAEQIAERAVAGPELARVVAAVVRSDLLDEAVARLLEAPALWVLVDEIARSPSVTEAIAHQGTGFVEEVAGSARERSRDADAWVARAARRLGRKRASAPMAERPDISMSVGVTPGPTP
jgi:hypothetical protein